MRNPGLFLKSETGLSLLKMIFRTQAVLDKSGLLPAAMGSLLRSATWITERLRLDKWPVMNDKEDLVPTKPGLLQEGFFLLACKIFYRENSQKWR